MFDDRAERPASEEATAAPAVESSEVEAPTATPQPEPTQNTEAPQLNGSVANEVAQAQQTNKRPSVRKESLFERLRLRRSPTEDLSELKAAQGSLEGKLTTYDAHLQALEQELNRAGSSQEKELIQQQINDVTKQKEQVASSYATNIVDRLRHGERVTEGQLLFLAQDVAINAERSALAEIFLKQQGFSTFQEALAKLNVQHVQAEEITARLAESNLPRVVKEHVTKLIISGGVSATVLGIIAACGGPVAWSAIGVGMAGGAIGRAIGEVNRYHQLGKERGKDESKYQLNQKLAQELLGQVHIMQTEGRRALEAAKNQNERADAIAQLLTKAFQGETATTKEYKKVEKKAAGVKAALGFIGAVGASLISNFFVAGHEATAKAVEAKAEGVRIFHDAAGQAHLTADASQGHVVKEAVDGMYRIVIEQKDITLVNELAAQKGNWVHNFFHSFSPSGHDTVVPNYLPSQELLHAGNETYGAALHQAINEFQNKIFIDSSAAILGASLATETGFLLHDRAKISAERLRRDNEPLITELEAEAVRERQRIKPERAPKPKNERERLTNLAKKLGVRLPETPKGFAAGWYNHPHVLEGDFRLDRLPIWPLIDANGKSVTGEAGQEKFDGVAEVDVENNEIVVVSKMLNGSYEARIMKLDAFLKTHGKPKIALPRGEAPAAARRAGAQAADREPIDEPRTEERLSQRLLDAVLGEETPLDLGTIQAGPAEAADAHRIFHQIADHYRRLSDEQKRNLAFSVQHFRDRNNNPGESINFYNPDEPNRSARLSFIRKPDGWRITTRDEQGRIDGNAMDRPIELGFVIDFMREARHRLEAVDNQEGGEDADSEPPASIVDDEVDSPPPPDPGPERNMRSFTQEEYNEHNAFKILDNVNRHVLSFVTRGIDRLADDDGLVNYKDVDVARDQITLVADSGEEKTFRLNFIERIIDHLDVIEVDDD